MKPRDLARRAKEAQRLSGLSQTELADRMNVTPSAISRAVNWTDNPNMGRLRKRIIEELTDSKIEGPIYLENRDGTETKEG
jgi:ribosome-binding protein aMBF1 (putative translation factor)